MTVDAFLDELGRHATRRPNAVALIETGGRRSTYAQLLGAVDRVASGLDALGVRPEDRVLFAVRPGLEAFVLVLALLRVGAVVVALEPGTGPELLARRIATAEARWAMAESLLLAAAAVQGARWLPERWRSAVPLPPPSRLRRAGIRLVRVGPWLPGLPSATSFAALARRRPTATRPGLAAAAEAPALLVFTSGTTEAPKAVVHSRRSVGATIRLFRRHLALDPSAVVYGTELHLVLPALHAGATAVIPRHRATPRRILHDLGRHHVTHLFSTPGNLAALAEQVAPAGRLPPTLRHILLGSAPVGPDVLRRARDVLPEHTEVWCVYGMTEVLPICRVDLREKLAFAGPGDLVGHPFPELALRLAPDGELLVRGPHQFRRYLGQQPVDEVATGDLAEIDALGRVILKGRKKDMIIRRGHNIYPGLYEPTIARIDGVGRCALVGVPDPVTSDELVVLAVQPTSSARRAELGRRLPHLLRTGEHRIDRDARPDRIVVMPIPLVRRSHEVDRAALRRLVAEVLRCDPGRALGC
jgi:acyl-CoA synthetase (AMP-forming)/AMP-acid ligase II